MSTADGDDMGGIDRSRIFNRSEGIDAPDMAVVVAGGTVCAVDVDIRTGVIDIVEVAADDGESGTVGAAEDSLILGLS